MNSKVIIIIVVVVIVAAGAVYFFTQGTGEKPEVLVEYSPGDFFTTNIRGSTHLLKTSPVLVVNVEGLEDMLAKENTRIRDTIIFILRDLSEDDIAAPAPQDGLRARIVKALNELLGIDNFVEVRFNDFVMG
ncbi:MAG: flagellar basal body-associated FliL family protein [Oscillospiraceae bacterium]|jgi:flagellar basal body-associated protein FliL|nr:flagellar basal body-associated FliL family protein [Oscillospiraceae bacterium]